MVWESARSTAKITATGTRNVKHAIFFSDYCSSLFKLISVTQEILFNVSLGPRISFFLYLRLALLMGMTWVSGLVAGIVDLEPVWYVFLVLNTLQVIYFIHNFYIPVLFSSLILDIPKELFMCILFFKSSLIL